MYDITIIGAGVIGTMIARELSRYNLNICLLEKESDVSCGASKANSGIIHGGYDAKHGTMKSKFARQGNRLFAQLEAELNFGYSETGSLVLAYSEEDFVTLEALKLNGIANGVMDLEILDQESVRAMEAHINENVKGALYCPSAGVASPYELTIALAENAIANGVSLHLNSEVTGIEKSADATDFKIHTKTEIYTSKILINAAGAYSDKIAAMIGVDDFYIIPRRGEYVLLNKTQGHLAQHVLFQCPTDKGKGILVTRTHHGNLMLGPNAQEVDHPTDLGTSKDVLNYIVDTARNSIPDFKIQSTLTSFSGIRATSNLHDFIIEESSTKGFINVAGIESPGLTASPAIGKYVVSLVKATGLLAFEDNSHFNPYRNPIIIPKSPEFDGTIDALDPSKHIICRCEKVTEAEIIDALNRGIDIDSTDSIKRRTRAGMGQCQGNFCGSRVANVIARVKNIALDDVPKRGRGSSILPPRDSRFYLDNKESD